MRNLVSTATRSRATGSVAAFVRRSEWKVRRRLTSIDDDDQFVAALIGRSPGSGEVASLLEELRTNGALFEHLRTLPDHWATDFGPSLEGRYVHRLNLSGYGRGLALMLYVVPRLLRPTTVVETGCHTGLTSALLLAALNANGHGHLTTLDLPTRFGQFGMIHTLPDGAEPGFTIPDAFRDRFTYIEGDITGTLASQLEALGPLDFFWHDSDHAYLHAMWEYTSGWQRLRPGGVLASDDLGWSLAFSDFAAGVGVQVNLRRGNYNVGAVRKPA